jgi:DegV family protein with EDD domain
MTIKIITDSVCDLPSEVVRDLDITIIPINVCFGTEVFRDGVDISTEEFYRRLETGKVFPTTAVPPPAIMAATYDKVTEKADELIVVTLSQKLSGLYNAACQAVELMEKKCRVEVVDSRCVIMAQGFVVMKAAEAACRGATTEEVLKLIQYNSNRVATYSMFDTLEYLKRGGRISKIAAMMGNLFNVHPLLGIKDGEVVSLGKRRSREEALDALYDFVMEYKAIEEMAVEYYKATGDADRLLNRLNGKFPKERVYHGKTSPVIGAHTGPNLLVVAVLGDK